MFRRGVPDFGVDDLPDVDVVETTEFPGIGLGICCVKMGDMTRIGDELVAEVDEVVDGSIMSGY